MSILLMKHLLNLSEGQMTIINKITTNLHNININSHNLINNNNLMNNNNTSNHHNK